MPDFWWQVPAVYPSNPTHPARLLLGSFVKKAQTGPVWVAGFGDSQESQSGDNVIFATNEELFATFGTSPGSSNLKPGGIATTFCGGTSASGQFVGDSQFTVTSATTTSITSTGFTSATDLYKDFWVRVTVGANQEWARVISQSAQTITITALTGTPSGTFRLYPYDPRAVPPNCFGSVHVSSTTGPLLICYPDNKGTYNSRYRGYLANEVNVSFLPLPAVPASLSSAQSYTLSTLHVKRSATAVNTTLSHKPNTIPVQDYSGGLQTTLDSNFITAAQALSTDATDTQFILKQTTMPFAATKPYLQAQFAASTAGAGAHPIAIGRWKVPNGRGMIVDWFGGGGFTADRYSAWHPNMKKFFDAWEKYDFCLVHLGANDSNVNSATFKTNLVNLISHIRTSTGCSLVVLVTDPPASSLSGSNQTNLDEQAGVMKEVADEDTLRAVVVLNTRRLFEISGFTKASETSVAYRGQYGTGTAYVVGDIVFDGLISSTDTAASNRYYRCTANTTGNRPPNASFWEDITWRPNTSYASGVTLAYYLPNTELALYTTIRAITSTSSATPERSADYTRVEGLTVDGIHLTPEAQRMQARFLVGLLTGSYGGPAVVRSNYLWYETEDLGGNTN